MESSKVIVSRAMLGLALAGLSLAGVALSGCANPGFPRAPSLHLPDPVTDLTAKRIADRVELQWTAPTRTTDGLDLTIRTTVEICRDASATPPAASSVQPLCTPVLRVAGHAGLSSAVDQLPASLTNAQAARQLVVYRVRVVNSSGRAAAPTAVALVPAGPAPAPVNSFRAIQKKNGVVLDWLESAPGSEAMVEVLRTDLTVKAVSPPPHTGGGSTGTRRAPNPIAGRRKTDPSIEVRLQQDAVTPPATTSGLGGMIDESASADGIYSYRAQRVLAVHADGKTFEIFGEPTAPILVAMRDTFPPNVPQGLASIPGATARIAGTASHPTIDLSWQPNAEADLAGYYVYRTELGGTTAGSGIVRLTATPVPGPAYRDATVVPGRRYAYRVTAVDRKGNESVQSDSIEDTPEGR